MCVRYFYTSPPRPSFTVLSPPASSLFSLFLSLTVTGVFLVQRRLCRSTNRKIREGNVRDAAAAAAAAYVCICERTCVSVFPRVLLRRAASVCVRARAQARVAAALCGRARACVCTRRCARERFTPDYNASRTSDCSNIERRSRGRGKARAMPKIVSANARIYRAALTALSRAESIYFVGTVCAANTVG